MRWTTISLVALLFATPSLPRDRQPPNPPPDRFEIGRRTFWDFGPPFDYYDLFLVRPSGGGATVDRIILTPAADQCFAPAKIETTSVSISVSPKDLLESTNPCAIPEKDLERKRKSCKHCQRFSGAVAVMRVRCGAQTRLIRSDIFEDYWFNPAAKPPKNTLSILQLVKRLDDAVGPGVTDKKVFDFGDAGDEPPKPGETEVLRSLDEREYDELFEGAPDKPSELYRAAQSRPLAPSVTFVSSTPYAPEDPLLPKYPPIARLARIEGQVTFTGTIDANGTPRNIAFVNGHRLFQAAVLEAVSSWKFPKDALNQTFHATIEFLLNCHAHTP